VKSFILRTQTNEGTMRTFVAAVASLGLFTMAVQGAENSPVAGLLPDTEDNLHVYLFQLKKNGISLQMTPEDFCKHMHYGHAVPPFYHQLDEVGDDHKVEKVLDWVICRFQGH
jgi:hypothetical protein